MLRFWVCVYFRSFIKMFFWFVEREWLDKLRIFGDRIIFECLFRTLHPGHGTENCYFWYLLAHLHLCRFD